MATAQKSLPVKEKGATDPCCMPLPYKLGSLLNSWPSVLRCICLSHYGHSQGTERQSMWTLAGAGRGHSIGPRGILKANDCKILKTKTAFKFDY